MEALQRAYLLGRERDIYFGMPAIEYVYEKIPNEAFQRLGGGEFLTKDLKVIAHFIYAGLMGGAERKDDKLDIEFADVYDEVERIMFEADTNGVMAKVGKAFSESNTVKWSLEKATSKKKEVLSNGHTLEV